MTLGICSSEIDSIELPYEIGQLSDEGNKYFDEVVTINPQNVSYLFERGASRPSIILDGQDLPKIDLLIVRKTEGCEASTAVLVRALKICGTAILDPIERFTVGKASKLLTTISRFEKNVGTSTYLAFTKSAAYTLVNELYRKNAFPLIKKPSSGSRGVGVELINDLMAAISAIDQHFLEKLNPVDPLFLQKYENFKHEYRLLLVDGQLLGIVEKFAAKGKIVANASQGGRFTTISSVSPTLVETALRNVSHEGVLGVDVAIDDSGGIHIIEANRAPQWQEYENATGSNVSRQIFEIAKRRLQN